MFNKINQLEMIYCRTGFIRPCFNFAQLTVGKFKTSRNRSSRKGKFIAFYSIFNPTNVIQMKNKIHCKFVFIRSEAGCTPFAASILTDYFPRQSRGLAIGVYNWGIYMGYSLAYAFGNFVSLANINGQVRLILLLNQQKKI